MTRPSISLTVACKIVTRKEKHLREGRDFMRRALLVTAFLLCTLNSCERDKPTQPLRSLEGTWNLIGYTDHGTSGVTTGTATFLEDGTFAIIGTVTYPGEPLDSLNVSGTYEVQGTIVILTTQEGTGAWSLSFSSNQVVLNLVGSSPPTTIALLKQA